MTFRGGLGICSPEHGLESGGVHLADDSVPGFGWLSGCPGMTHGESGRDGSNPRPGAAANELEGSAQMGW
jgi:hypothetical protein